MSRVLRLTLVAILAILLAPGISGAAGKKSKSKSTPLPAPPADATEYPMNGDLFSLAGQAGLPAYMKCNQPVVGGPVGLRGGQVRTIDTNYVDKDFVFDVVFQFSPDSDRRASAFIGIGEWGERGPLGSDCVVAELHGPNSGADAVVYYTRDHDHSSLGQYKTAGPHLFRLEKTGDAVTVSITQEFKGKFRKDFVKSIPNFKATASFLNRLNSNLFFGGDAVFSAVRLEVDGKVVDPGPAPAAYPEIAGNAGWASFAPGSALPPFLDGKTGISIGKDGLEFDGKVLKTHASDFLTKDFTLDVLYQFKPEEKAIFLIGLGENGRNDGNWILNSVCSRVHGPGHGGHATITFHDFYNEPIFARLGHDHPGPNLFRLEKRGDTLLMAICADFKDKYEPDFIAVLPSLKYQAPKLTEKNTYLFFGDHGTVTQLRLSINGKLVTGDGKPEVAQGDASKPPAVAPGSTHPAVPASAPPAPAVATSAPAPSPINAMFHLGGAAGIPPYLHADPQALADAQGLRGEVRSSATDYINHDFTFDILYLQAHDDRQFVMGFGEVAQYGRPNNGATIRTDGPDYNEGVYLGISGQGESGIGGLGKGPGPNLLRMQKQGNTLTFALCANYNGTFTPDISRTIPDLKAVAPNLTRINSSFYFTNGATVLAVNLWVDGKPADTGARPAATAVATKNPAAAPGPAVTATASPAAHSPAAAPATAVNPALDGVRNFIKLTGPRLPTYFETQRDLKFTPEGLSLKETHLRTREADFINKNFTFDIVFHFKAEHESLLVGIGADEREGGWVRKTVAVRVHSEDQKAHANILIDKVPDGTLGGITPGPAPHLLRLQKRGNVLTLALCDHFTGTFTADSIKTLPDLVGVAPYLDAKNSSLFMDDGGVIEQVRLVVEGQSVESTDMAMDIPARIVEGQPMRRALVKAAGTRQFSAEAGAPRGLTIAGGQIAWTPGHDQLGVHEFKIRIADKGQSTEQTVSIEVIGADDAKSAGGDLAKVDALYRLPLAGEEHRIVPGLGGKSLLLLEGDSLRRLAGDGLTVLQTLKLPHAYQWIGERDKYFVALSDASKSLDEIDKGTLQVTRSIQMDYYRRHDLCLHPLLPISYVAVEKATENGFVQSILIVSEPTGEVREPEGFVGTWIKIAADGNTMFAAYKDIYRRGSRLLFNPNRVDVIPEYGSIDILIVYDLSHPITPQMTAAKNGAGGNGFGLAISPDGKLVSYLSFVGYPLYSKNIPAWDPTDFTKRPISFAAAANHADCKRLAYHPVLPIAAAPAQAGALCFQTETGDLQPDRLDLRTPLGEAKVHDLIFSPDGKNLILDCEFHGDSFLRRVKLNLSPDDRAKIQQGPPAPAIKPPAPVKPGETNLRS